MSNLQPFLSPTLNHPLLHHHPFWVSWFGSYRCYKSNKQVSRTNANFIRNQADSEFEIDPDKARDALRKLDQQLDLISQKQANPIPKIKGSSPYNAREEVTKDVPDTGSFLPYVFFGLLMFTIVYNIVFIKVIKPSIDGPQVELAPVRSSIMTQILKAE
ncbi:hypothetical protein R6Q59_013513 [Mikania micrantha]|uniref:Uncharacterized protein n=1 Tax=Mikania micrantha TaxID=192012 RepID=A0A5N6P574_9ASTR|nr:hypothetical protein E3N88_11856 [Mikania micrantha]